METEPNQKPARVKRWAGRRANVERKEKGPTKVERARPLSELKKRARKLLEMGINADHLFKRNRKALRHARPRK